MSFIKYVYIYNNDKKNIVEGKTQMTLDFANALINIHSTVEFVNNYKDILLIYTNDKIYDDIDNMFRYLQGNIDPQKENPLLISLSCIGIANKDELIYIKTDSGPYKLSYFSNIRCSDNIKYRSYPYTNPHDYITQYYYSSYNSDIKGPFVTRNSYDPVKLNRYCETVKVYYNKPFKYTLNHKLVIYTESQSYYRMLPSEIVNCIPLIQQLRESATDNNNNLYDELKVPDYYDQYIETVLDYLSNLTVERNYTMKISVGELSLFSFLGFNINTFFYKRYYKGYGLMRWYDIIHDIYSKKISHTVKCDNEKIEKYSFDNYSCLDILIPQENKDILIKEFNELGIPCIPYTQHNYHFLHIRSIYNGVNSAAYYIDYNDQINPALLTRELVEFLYKECDIDINLYKIHNHNHLKKILTLYLLKDEVAKLEKELFPTKS
jgi:hypothetical protein